MDMTEVLRSAIAEVEQYSRVRLVPPIDGTLRGHAVADVIHLLAELVENATLFSAPQTQVLMRANLVTSGLAVEVEDRGLGMPVAEQSRMNALLADPDQVNVARLLADGRIGLYVVSQLAKRHGITVRLQTNIYGGVQAVLVVPQALLGGEPGALPGGGARTGEDTGAEPVPVPSPRQHPRPATPQPSTAAVTSPPSLATPVAPASVGHSAPAGHSAPEAHPASLTPVAQRLPDAPAPSGPGTVPAPVAPAPRSPRHRGRSPPRPSPRRRPHTPPPPPRTSPARPDPRCPAPRAGASPFPCPCAAPVGTGRRRPPPCPGSGPPTGVSSPNTRPPRPSPATARCAAPWASPDCPGAAPRSTSHRNCAAAPHPARNPSSTPVTTPA